METEQDENGLINYFYQDLIEISVRAWYEGAGTTFRNKIKKLQLFLTEKWAMADNDCHMSIRLFPPTTTWRGFPAIFFRPPSWRSRIRAWLGVFSPSLFCPRRPEEFVRTVQSFRNICTENSPSEGGKVFYPLVCRPKCSIVIYIVRQKRIMVTGGDNHVDERERGENIVGNKNAESPRKSFTILTQSYKSRHHN